ncbi:MAG: ATP-binding cassette domain-containing protein [Propionibacteriaceae bacterium]|jgi:energy-coupling factor transport system ATP-binding protein|nr:ATP-binding cassette domain-containing protein [Propionibacteriaceae bacterium]
MALVAFESLTFSYPQGKREVLSDVNAILEPGEFVLLIGESGCGKTTLLRHLKTALTPHGSRLGTVRFDERLLTAVSSAEQARRIGFVLQNPDNQIVTDKVWHELAFGLESLGIEQAVIRRRVAEMASFFGVGTWYHRDVATLSGGQKQLLNLAAVMTLQPDLLILDEPTAQLDPIAAMEFLAAAKRINDEIGTTVLVSEHRLETAFPLCDRVLVMNAGRLIVDELPRNVGRMLAKTSDPMVAALPTAVKLALALGANSGADLRSTTENPISIREGRAYLRKKLSLACSSQVEVAEVCAGIATSPSETPAADVDVAGVATKMNAPVGESCAGAVCAVMDVGEGGDSAAGMGGSDVADVAGAGVAIATISPSGLRDITTRTVVTTRDREATSVITAQDVWFRYDKNGDDVLRGVDLKVYQGEFACIVGGNGGGKTTTLGVLSGAHKPYRGKLSVLGLDPKKASGLELFRAGLAVLPQDPQTLFMRNTIADDLGDAAAQHYKNPDERRSAVRDAATTVGITQLLERHPYDVSGGEKQRAALAMALLTRPKLLLLDEPTKGMDNPVKTRLAELLQQLTADGLTILMVSHDVEFASVYASRCLLFFDGSVVAEGTPREFFAGNSFYTTAANRLGRGLVPGAVNVTDLVTYCRSLPLKATISQDANGGAR